MLLSRRDFRAIMFYEFARGSTAEECQASLERLFGGKVTPELAVVERCFGEFRKTRAYLAEESSKYPRVLTTEYAEAARKLLRRSPRITVREFEEALGLSARAARLLISEHLDLEKRSAGYWQPKTLNAAQKEERLDWSRLIVRRFENGCSEDFGNIVSSGELYLYRYDEPDGKNARGDWSVSYEETEGDESGQSRGILEKRTVMCFFSKERYIATIPLDPSLSRMTVAWITDHMLPRLQAEWKAKCGQDRELFLHHEKTDELTAAKTIKYLLANNAQLLPHPDCSPDLLITDYFLFPKLKQALGSRRFSSPEEAVKAVQAYVDAMEADTWPEAFKTWLRRIKLCTKAGGDYFEL